MARFQSLIFVLTLLTLSRYCVAWSWFYSSASDQKPTETLQISGEVSAEFSMETFNDEKGKQRVKDAQTKLAGLKSSCWHNAYQGLFATSCSEIASEDSDKKKRFAWDLSNCFQKDSGRTPFPACREGSPMKECLAKLDNNAIHTYRGFYLETNSICHQLQSVVFRIETQRLVNELVKSANYAEGKLETIEEKSEKLLQGSKEIHISLTSIDQQTQEVAQTSKKVSDRIGAIVKQSDAMFEQSVKIAATQLELQKGQDKMKENLQEGIEVLHESYHVLGQGIHSLQTETIEIERKVTEVGDAMSTKMSNLQSKADDIGNVAGISLEKQKELLQGQSEALGGLQSLTKFQFEALEESRGILNKLAKFGREQQEELLQKQEQIQQGHDDLFKNSKSILAAQEAFEQKQATMFVTLDKLFALHNALLLESRSMKAFFFYAISMFVIYMASSTKQTYKVRHLLYIGLWIAFFIEFATLQFSINGIEQQTLIVNAIRKLYGLFAVFLISYAYFTFRDYEKLTYNMLKSLTDDIISIKKRVANPWDDDSDDGDDYVDDDADWITFVDTDVKDGVENILSSSDHEVGDNSNPIPSITGRYNLRSRR